MTGTTVFPLRSNAHALVAGTPARSVVRRIKIAAVMHDHVLLEDGAGEIRSGPAGTVENREPPGADAPQRWQGARRRAIDAESEMYLAFGPTGGPMMPVIQSPITISRDATYAPIKNELRRAYPWLEFGTFDLLPRAAVRQFERTAMDPQWEGRRTLATGMPQWRPPVLRSSSAGGSPGQRSWPPRGVRPLSS